MNDQRQVIFSQRLKILKEKEISQVIGDFFDETLKNLNISRSNYQKSGDEKNYLSELKNITGNSISDDKLLEIAKLSENEFNIKIKDLYSNKRKSRIEILGKEQNDNLEKNIFANNRFFLEITSSIPRAIKASNWIKTVWPERSFIRI